MKFYRFLRGSLFILLTLYLLAGIAGDISPKLYEQMTSTEALKSVFKPYEGFKSYLAEDPYQKGTLYAVEQEKSFLENHFLDRAEQLTNLISSSHFNEQIFSYLVFGKIADLDPTTISYFEDYEDFEDFLLVSEEGDLIYKYGQKSLPVRFYETPTELFLSNLGSGYAILYTVDDDVLDAVYQAMAVFETDGINERLTLSEFPAFIYFSGKLYSNESFDTDDFFDHRQDLLELRKVKMRLKQIESWDLTLSGLPYATLGMQYPIRSFGNYLLIFAKYLALIALLFALFALDRLLTNSMKKNKISREEGKFLKPTAKSKKNDDLNEKLEEDMNWVDSYIKETEAKR